jgi:hypothetical protein
LEWTVRNLASGVSPRDVVAALVQGGVAPSIALRDVEHVAASPLAVPLLQASRERARLRELVELQRDLRRGDALEELDSPPAAATFFARYWATNTPVVLRGYLQTWQRPFVPTFEDLRARFGAVEIAITSGRERFDDPGPHFDELTRRSTLGDFIDVVLGSPSNDQYLVARNSALAGPLSKLLDDIEPPQDLFDTKGRRDGVSLWLGPRGTLTRLHHDGTNNLFCQVLGEKRLALVPPWETSILSTAFGYYARERPTAAHLAPSVKHVVLEPGDAIFLPVGWWHEVESLSPSLSLALVGFRRPNTYSYQPGRTGSHG